MRVFAANRKELWVSMAVVVCACLLQVVPIGFKGALLLAGSIMVGLVCAINAFMDRDEMGVVRRMSQASGSSQWSSHTTHTVLARHDS